MLMVGRNFVHCCIVQSLQPLFIVAFHNGPEISLLAPAAQLRPVFRFQPIKRSRAEDGEQFMGSLASKIHSSHYCISHNHHMQASVAVGN